MKQAWVQFNSSRLATPTWAVVETPDTPKPGKPCLNRRRETGEFPFPQHFRPAGTSVFLTETEAFDDALSGRSGRFVSRTNAGVILPFRICGTGVSRADIDNIQTCLASAKGNKMQRRLVGFTTMPA
ncbi:MAG: hypothetical protein ABJM26_07250 [Anderseniella sp.]